MGYGKCKSEYKLRFDFNNLKFQNCGPRPQGPLYPSPPKNSTGDYYSTEKCDIIEDANYSYWYECNTVCQEKLWKFLEFYHFWTFFNQFLIKKLSFCKKFINF